MNTLPVLPVLSTLKHGELLAELAFAVQAACNAVKDRRGAATVTLSIKIRPSSKEALDMTHPPVLVTAEITSKLPPEVPEVSVFFLDAEGNPIANKPREERGLELAIGERANG